MLFWAHVCYLYGVRCSWQILPWNFLSAEKTRLHVRDWTCYLVSSFALKFASHFDTVCRWKCVCIALSLSLSHSPTNTLPAAESYSAMCGFVCAAFDNKRCVQQRFPDSRPGTSCILFAYLFWRYRFLCMRIQKVMSLTLLHKQYWGQAVSNPLPTLHHITHPTLSTPSSSCLPATPAYHCVVIFSVFFYFLFRFLCLVSRKTPKEKPVIVKVTTLIMSYAFVKMLPVIELHSTTVFL